MGCVAFVMLHSGGVYGQHGVLFPKLQEQQLCGSSCYNHNHVGTSWFSMAELCSHQTRQQIMPKRGGISDNARCYTIHGTKDINIVFSAGESSTIK